MAEHFQDPSVRRSIQTDLALIDAYDQQLGELELHLVRHAKIDDGNTFQRLHSIPGVGKILVLTLLPIVSVCPWLARGRKKCRLPASLVAGLAGKEPGVCYTLRRKLLTKKGADDPKK